MIRGIGIDAVEIARFVPWIAYPRHRLERVFSDAEIDYCLSIPIKSAERFAARFATKEAFFKALSAVLPEHGVPFLAICKNSSLLRSTKGIPELTVNWNALRIEKELYNSLNIHISATHTQTIATSIVILESIRDNQ